MHSRPKLAANT